MQRLGFLLWLLHWVRHRIKKLTYLHKKQTVNDIFGVNNCIVLLSLKLFLLPVFIVSKHRWRLTICCDDYWYASGDCSQCNTTSSGRHRAASAPGRWSCVWPSERTESQQDRSAFNVVIVWRMLQQFAASFEAVHLVIAKTSYENMSCV